MRHLFLLYRILLLILLGLGTNLLAQKMQVRIGLILDGPSSQNEQLIENYRREVTTMLEDEYDVVFPADRTLIGDWSAEGVAVQTDQLLNDPTIDIVVAVGFLSSQKAATRTNLPKPLFASAVIDPELQGVPVQMREISTLQPGETETYRVSGVKNLSYLLYGGGGAADLERFSKLFEFSRLAILAMDAMMEVLPGMKNSLDMSLSSLDVEQLELISVGESVAAALASLPAGIQAVFVTPMMHLSQPQFDELVEGLNQRHLVTLSARGREEVVSGLLASLYPSDDYSRRARRTAISIHEALGGQDPGEMSIEYRRDSKLILNMATARRIGLSLPYKVLLAAEILNEEPDQFARTLSLGAVVREASTLNLDLLAADKRVSAGEEFVHEARSPLLPQVDLFGGLSVVDADRARVFPAVGEKEWAVNLEARQLLYSDRAWASYSIEKSLQDQRREERAQLRLDVIEEAARSYLNLLRGETIRKIQKDNLNLTRSNLELASSRVEIGVAGREELFRWQSQLATNQRNVVETEALRNQARIAVNRVLNRPLNELFGTVEASLNDPQFVASFEGLGPYIDNPRGFHLFSEFMTDEALAAAPELAQLEAAIRARQRELKAAQRSFFLPDFSLSGGLKAFKPFGEGSELPEGLNSTDWFVGLNASIPLFQGGERIARVNRLNFQLQELTVQRDALSQRVEQRIRSLLEAANASFLGIDLSRAQAEAARENLQLVTDSYAAGVVGILALLDAQNETLVADLVSANAVFQYLGDLMSVQRAVGRFDFFRTPEESQAFLSRLDQFYRERGVRVPNP